MALAVEILYVQNRSRPLIGQLYSCMHASMYKITAVCVCEYKCVFVNGSMENV